MRAVQGQRISSSSKYCIRACFDGYCSGRSAGMTSIRHGPIFVQPCANWPAIRQTLLRKISKTARFLHAILAPARKRRTPLSASQAYAPCVPLYGCPALPAFAPPNGLAPAAVPRTKRLYHTTRPTLFLLRFLPFSLNSPLWVQNTLPLRPHTLPAVPMHILLGGLYARHKSGSSVFRNTVSQIGRIRIALVFTMCNFACVNIASDLLMANCQHRANNTPIFLLGCPAATQACPLYCVHQHCLCYIVLVMGGYNPFLRLSLPLQRLVA